MQKALKDALSESTKFRHPNQSLTITTNFVRQHGVIEKLGLTPKRAALYGESSPRWR